MYYPIFRTGAQQKLKIIRDADLVIGLPTYKNARAAAHVANVALRGVQEHYPDLRVVLLNADAGKTSTTREAIIDKVETHGSNITIVTGRYSGKMGHGSATAAMLDAGLALDAKAIVILDSHTQTITPNWIAGLAHLVMENKADLVMPRYQWPTLASRGTLSDLLIYPLMRALWGTSVRRPAAPDFALSPKLASDLLDEDIWGTEAFAFGLPPWLTSYAILGGWKVAQTALGEKRTTLDLIYKTNGRGAKKAQRMMAKFRAQFENVMTVVFRLAHIYREHWEEVNRFESLTTLTRFADPTDDLRVDEQDPTPLLDNLASSWIDYRSLWQRILTEENLVQLEQLASLRPENFYFPADLWARIVYDYAIVFNKGDCDPYQVVKSLYPIYQGRLAAFSQEIAGLSFVGREGTIAAQAVEFEESRDYLKQRWATHQPWFYSDEVRRGPGRRPFP